MCEVKRIKAVDMFIIINEILQQGGKAWITVTGMSMYPFLRENKDSVELASGSFETIKRGDIVLIRRMSGEYILHRVLYKNADSFYIIGDAQQWIEGPLKAYQLVAAVAAIKRGDFPINCNNLIWRILTALWLYFIPVRHWVFKGLSFLRKSIINVIRKRQRGLS